MSKKIVWWFITILITLAIFCFSAQPDYASNDLSMKVTEKIVNVAPLANEGKHDVVKQWNTYTRKYAHFFLFLLLGISTSLALKYTSTNKSLSALWLITLTICLLYSVSDEIHQIYVPGRGCRLTDVMIDFSGSFLGSLSVWGIVKLYKNKHAKSGIKA